jgi:protein gp37
MVPIFDDGLVCPKVGKWAEEKHGPVSFYAKLFSTGMKDKWDLHLAPAKVRFLSVEPLLEDLGEIDLSGITWVIVGGESGPGARPMRREWVISIRRQCREKGVAFFFKQWGGVRKATWRPLTAAVSAHHDSPSDSARTS